MTSDQLSMRKEKPAYKLEPPEGGWGWMVAFGMTLIFVSRNTCAKFSAN